ncbi:hypothetical protein [Nocardiopsis sp. HUAS JQ3]|uniref:hypothetical protein n=1 Tax=Nocardiopsis sp. HUAS JQ3 TaxID=3061629 RepID=UPI0023A944D7|nr:hypothetical protein [Nocardiopsis sp. HUAS JQ3]WDZ91176.1 hypothetical protein PV789_00940 [Nocardiopsis sp. HUAS JQ3]
MYRKRAPDGTTHTLFVLADTLTGGRLLHSYTHHLTGPMRPLIWRYVVQAPDPLHGPADPRLYWWTDDMPVTLDHVRWCEIHGITDPWPHGHDVGPLLGPSRA